MRRSSSEVTTSDISVYAPVMLVHQNSAQLMSIMLQPPCYYR